MQTLRTILAGAMNAGLLLLLAPLLEGLLRKLTAVAQSRRGPPIAQPYYDLFKLLCKEDIESGEVPVVQRFASYLAFASVLAAGCLAPMGGPAPLGMAGDSLLLIYMLTLCGVATLLAGLAAGSTFSLVGTSREMMTMVALEPLFAVAIVIGAVHAGNFDLNVVLGGAVYATKGFPVSGVLMLLVMALSMQAFVQRVPFDISEAETEIMEGPLMEYSGPKLALFKYAHMAKLMLYSSLFVGLFVPWGSELAFPLNRAVFLGKVVLVVVVVTLVAATHARLRIDRALRYFAGLLALALVALVLAGFGH